jgi:hypothetical protein
LKLKKMDNILEKVNEVNPVDPSFINKVKEIDKRQYEQQTARQPYVGDWFELNDSDYSINTASSGYPNLGILDCSNYDPRTRHTLGDRMRLKQGGAYAYFFITDMSSNTISVTGDISAVLSATTPTNMAVSKVAAPLGFPSTLTVRVAVSPSAGTTLSISTLDVEMYMIGSVVRFIKQMSATVSVATSNVIYVKLPVERAQAYMNPIGDQKPWYCNDSGTQTIGYPIFEEPFMGPANTIGIYKWDANPWSISGGQTLYINVDYDYIISLT